MPEEARPVILAVNLGNRKEICQRSTSPCSDRRWKVILNEAGMQVMTGKK